MSCEILAIFLKRHVFSTLNFFSALSGLINSTHFSSNSRTNHLLLYNLNYTLSPQPTQE